MNARETFQRNWTGLFELLPSYTASARCWREGTTFIGISGWTIGAFNTAILDHEHHLTVAHLDKLSSLFNGIDLPYCISVCSPTPVPDCDGLLRTHRYHRWFADPLMGLEGTMKAVAPLPDSRIVTTLVDTPEKLAVYAAVVQKVFDLPPVVGDSYLAVMGQLPNARQMIAYREEKPVGVGMLLCCNGTAGIYELGTVPTARRQGVGTALCAALHQMALSAGYSGTVLASSVMGLSLYARLGYQSDGYQVAYSR